MYQIITSWNLADPKKEAQKIIDEITIRGYNAEEAFLTGELAANIKEQNIKSLSVSNIADRLCPTRRDLYLNKGKNKPSGIRIQERWGRIAGPVIEKYIYNMFDDLCRRRGIKKYNDIKQRLETFSTNFKNEHEEDFSKLNSLKTKPGEEPDWLLRLLDFNGRAELGSKLLHKEILANNGMEINIKDLKINKDDAIEINPDPIKIGISKHVKPDFLIEKFGIVGDIKSGIGGFKDRYLLTCVGYALAYENEKGKGHDINFGIIYYFPTRHSEYVKPVTFSQVYIFPIDDNLRQWFIDFRNKDYKIISKDTIPDFPEMENRNDCSLYCKFYDDCTSRGLTYEQEA